jgi:D-amino-acid dehydrogenase
MPLVLSSPRIVVIGAGIIGLSAAYHLVRAGARVTVIDRNPEGDKASFGNAGAIAVTEVVPASVPGVAWRVPRWLLDPLGPLAIRPRHAPRLVPWLVRFARCATPSEMTRISDALAALNASVYDDLLPMLTHIGRAAELHRTGALNVYETEEGYAQAKSEWELKRSHGIETQELTGDQAREMEPALGDLVRRAVFTPQWSHVSDPKRIVDGLREWLLAQQVVIQRGEVRRVLSDPQSPLTVQLEDGRKEVTDKLVVAAGAWSALLARDCGDRVLLESERGYNVTMPSPTIQLGRQLTFAERHFVATPLSCGLRVGGAAEFGGLSAKPDYRRSQALLELARRYLPRLQTEGGTCWAGHRPTTPDSLPVIGPSQTNPNVFYAFGHGHLGLTQAATTGKLVCQSLIGPPPALDLTPYSVTRFA